MFVNNEQESLPHTCHYSRNWGSQIDECRFVLLFVSINCACIQHYFSSELQGFTCQELKKNRIQFIFNFADGWYNIHDFIDIIINIPVKWSLNEILSWCHMNYRIGHLPCSTTTFLFAILMLYGNNFNS